MSEREYTLTVTLKRTFQRKVQSAKHRAEVVAKIERALPKGWVVDASSIRAGASEAQQARTQKKVQAKVRVTQAMKQAQKLSHIARSLPMRLWIAEVLKNEGLSDWTVGKARNTGGRCIPSEKRILLGAVNEALPGIISYKRLRAWAQREGIDVSAISRPVKVFLHEVAHATDCVKNGWRKQPGQQRRAWHGKLFRREYKRLLKKYAPQVFMGLRKATG
jgi:hypothetical protein